MKQKAVAMATAFTMLLAVGVTGLGCESLHQHPAYTSQNNIRLETQSVPVLTGTGTDTLLLAAPTQEEK